jgi:membrane fusion protein (multidrug efflux system)
MSTSNKLNRFGAILGRSDRNQSPEAGVVRKAAVLAACVAMLLVTACDKAAPPPPAPPVVGVMSVIQKDVPIYNEWIGVMDGDVNATIRPQVTGYLIRQNYREGDAVRKGQLLFEIDPSTFKVAVDQAQAVQAKQKAIYDTASANLARIKPLAAKNAVSQKDLDDALGQEASARAALDQATAALETARLNLGFTRVTSPIDGIAGIAKAQIGDLLSPSATSELTTVSKVDPIKVYVNISEREYVRWLERNPKETALSQIPLELILIDGTTFPMPGRFALLNRQVDPTTGTFKVGALFPNPKGTLRPGQFARIRATASQAKGALLVPQRAVTEVQGKYLVAVVGEGNKANLRPVKVGDRIGSDWIISEGLKPGEQIIVEGTQKVRDGVVVDPKPFDPAAKPASPASAPAKPASKG